MFVVAGLGNPGAAYAQTRHNVGWWVLDRLADRWKAGESERNTVYRARALEVRGKAVSLLQPLTFMNLSGEALVRWRDRHELELERLMVITDDVYLPAGHIRIRPRGSSGGHRGLESIEASLESREFPRLRIGVGAVDAAGLKDHVLDEPQGSELEDIETATERAAEAVELWIEQGVLAAMNRFNRRVGKEVSES